MNDIVVVVPVLGRPHRVAPLVASFEAARKVPSKLLFVCSPEDDPQREACRTEGHYMAVLDEPAGPGDFAKKINYAYRITEEPFLFQAADDVTFQPGWDLEALRVIEKTDTGVCGTNDGANPTVMRGIHSTHSLIRRSYVNECGACLEGPGVVFSPAYGHQWVDNELVELAKSRGCYSFAHNSFVLHSHPIWGTAQDDATYRKGNETARADRDLFRQRARQWNPSYMKRDR